MPELGPYGSVRGARGNSRLYRDHFLCFFCVRKLLLGKRSYGRPQDFAVKAVLAAEMVVYRGLVHPRSGDNGPHARILIPVISKQPLRGFKNPFACHVRWSRHVPIPKPFFKLVFE